MAQKINVADIVVNDRQRKEYKDIEQLAESIRKYGLLNPVTLNQNNELLAGGRRLTAMLMLGWTDIPYETVDSRDEIRNKEIELEENLQRSDLTWQEEQAAIAEIHNIKMKNDPNWTADKTADLIGKSRRTVFNAMELTRAINKHEDVRSADTAHGAIMRLERIKQLERRKEAVSIAETAARLGLRVESSNEPAKPRFNVDTFHQDVLEALDLQEDESIDTIFTDPPYGVGIESILGTVNCNDKADETAEFLALLYPELYRILKPDHWFIMFWPTRTLSECYHLLDHAGFNYDPVPWIWYKPNKLIAKLANPQCDVNIQYETLIFARKGNAQWVERPADNVLIYNMPDRNRLHPLQKPVELWQEVLRYTTLPGEATFEPCSGSGSGAIACLRSGYHYQGYEKEERHYERSQLWLREEKAGVRSDGPIVEPEPEELEA
jgi:ParB family chromosome partitioning protein